VKVSTQGLRADRLHAAALLAHFLVIGAGRGHHELLGGGVKNRLLDVVGSIGQAGHLNLQRDGVLLLAHVGIDAQGEDF
jgi:hypothetical protein